MPAIEVNGVMIDYADAGTGEPLMLVHGLGSSHRDWDDQISLLSQHFRVVAPSMRGFGDSEKGHPSHSVKTWSEDLLAMADYVGFDTFHLLGFSMGGAISYQTAVDQQARLRSLTIINSQPSFELDEWYKHMMVLYRIAMAKVVGMKRMARFVAKRLFPEDHQADLRKRMIKRHEGNDQDSYIKAVQALAGWSVADRIDQLELPVLVLAADQDLTPLEDKLVYLEEMGNARLEVIRNSRHVSHVDQAEIVYELVRDHVLSVESRRPDADS
ncbi:MAG: alpha/beta fold hydrolase [Gammaproteobacteria bacterium]